MDINNNPPEPHYKNAPDPNFVNVGLNNWIQVRNSWRGFVEGESTHNNTMSSTTSSTPSTTMTPTKSNETTTSMHTKKRVAINGPLVIEELEKDGIFSQRIPLPDMVAILTETWAVEEEL
eukprot:TRINITY_DN3463_c0_g1_i1.p1 TRINITY_DN3463_c0_g1~~TRINITY_DN3463_c0_g1_i1.p1  ORF type:complete len:120 (-),score=40.25 TRINITY_DN3463_c0_g1_i1:201-560(-)